MNAYDLTGVINYVARTDFRQRYYANDHTRDTVVIAAHTMPIWDARRLSRSLADEGFVLAPHISRVGDFENAAQVAATHPDEIVTLLQGLSGADEVLITSPGILRFAESSGRAGSRNNSMPARFAHVDISDATAASFAKASLPSGRQMRRYAHYNVWRAISAAPQDVPLAVADARSFTAHSLLPADAIFDAPGRPEWGFEGYLAAYDPAHRWCWFPDMTRDEALVFRTSDRLLGGAVPHVAFDNPLAPDDCPPRVSIEMRAVAYWYA